MSNPTVNGIPCRPGRVLGPGGRYIVRIYRADASLDQIERIDWSQPTLAGCGDSLPDSCGYEVEDIRYRYADGYFEVGLRVQRESLGDVTAYAAQIGQLQEQLTAAQAETAAAQEQAQAARAQAAEAAEVLDIIVSGEEAAV